MVMALLQSYHLVHQPHHCLANLAQKFGPVMHLQLGELSTVVISSAEAAKQVMKTHDSIFCERPYLYALERLTYNFQDVVFARGDYRRQIRKICASELLSPKRVQSFRPIREEEISNLVATISSKAGETINLKNLLRSSALSIISRAAFGGEFKCQDEFQKLVPGIAALFGGLSVVDAYPSIKLLRLINALRPKLRRVLKKVDEILENVILEHRAAKLTMTKENELGDDFVQVLLDIEDHGDLGVPLSNSSVKAIILDLLLAGDQTSSNAVEWAMSEMLRNPKVLERAQIEVREAFAAKRDVNEAGVQDLKYLNLVIKESLRLHPPNPFLFPRECQTNCEVEGIVVPPKTRVIINAWAIGRNQDYWTDADQFIPERFCYSSINYKGTNFELIPFGAGRRICPGMSFGIASVALTLANLLYHFDWKLPDGKKPEDLDMAEIFGASLQRKHDLCLVPIPHHLMNSE